MYLLPKILKNLYDVPGRTIISNWGMPAEKTSEFFDSQSKEWSAIKGGMLLKTSVIL